MANVWRSLRLYEIDRELGASGGVAGGSQRLPEAMAARLGDAVSLGAPVLSAANDPDGVIIATMEREWRADFAILALPFPAIARLKLARSPTGAQAEAIANLPYTQIIQVHFETDRPFWETDGLPAAMWTDGPMERIFATRDEATGEIVGFNAWINGDGATTLSALSDEAIAARLKTELLRLRPATEGRATVRRVVRWTQGASYAGGAYMHWAPGQIAAWADAMRAPIGRIHLAGEHLSRFHTGMEGAMETGEAAAEAIFDASA